MARECHGMNFSRVKIQTIVLIFRCSSSDKMKLLFSLVLLANLPSNSVAKFASDVDYNEDVLDKYGDYNYKGNG